MEFPHYNITLGRQADINIDLLKHLLVSVKPEWKLEKVVLEDLSARGFLNVNIICRHEHDAVFVRISNAASVNIYNEELVQARKFVSKRGFSARLLCTFNNGFVEECLEGEPITWQTTHRLHDEEIKREIVAEMARYHTREVLEEAQSVGIHPIVPIMRKEYMDHLWEDIEKCGMIKNSVLDSIPGRDTISDELNQVNTMLDELGAEKAFCHSDINPSNVFVLKNGRVLFTDYETTCISYSAADVAYYFLLVNYDFAIFLLDTYPDEKYRRDFCREYLTEKRKITNDTSPVTDNDLDEFEQEVEVGVLHALLFYITADYLFLTNRMNTQIMDFTTEQVVAELRRVWPAYYAMKKAVSEKLKTKQKTIL